MKPNSKKRSANKSGAVLVTAVAVLIIMFILMTATVGYVTVNRRKTNNNYMRKQAYLTASSTLKSFVSQIQLDTAAPVDKTNAAALLKQSNNITALQNLAAANGGKGTTVDVSYNGGDGSNYQIGKTRINIKQEEGSTTKLVVTAYTTYGNSSNSVTEQVAAHISTQTKRKPADFTNTIEVCGQTNMKWDNLKILGDTAYLNKSARSTVKFANEIVPEGSWLMWGSVDNTASDTEKNTIILKPNLIDPSRGSYVQISDNWTGNIYCRSTMPRANGYNYVYIANKATFATNKAYIGLTTSEANDEAKAIKTNEVDLICGELVTGGNDFHVHGNVYVWKNGVSKSSGNATFGSGTKKIYGDLIVEGDINVTDGTLQIIGGTVKCGGTITGNVKVGSTVLAGEAKTKCEHVNVASEKSDRGAIPDMEFNYDEYKYFPEDFFTGSKPEFSSVSSEYKKFYNGTNKLTEQDFYDPTFKTTDGAAFSFHITKSCSIIGPHAFVAKSGSTYFDSSKGFTNGHNLIGDNNTILVDVKSDDIVLMMKCRSYNAENACKIVVRNLSGFANDDEGNVTNNHNKNCYLVSDSGDPTKITCTWDSDADKSKHTYADSSFKTDSSKLVTYNFDKLRVYEYDTYIHMYDAKYLASRGYNENYALRSDFILNCSDKDIAGTYRPCTSSTIMLMGENSKVGEGNCNNSYLQLSFYGPECDFLLKTNGLGNMKVCDASGNTSDSVNKNVLGLGVFIAKSFQSANTSYFLFNKPSSSCILSFAKGQKDNTLNGFVLDRFDHY